MKARLYYLRDRTGKAAMASRRSATERAPPGPRRELPVATPASRCAGELTRSSARFIFASASLLARLAFLWLAPDREPLQSFPIISSESPFPAPRRLVTNSFPFIAMKLATDILAQAAAQARGLAIDAVHKCSSGHLGLPLGCAEIGAVLYGHALVHNPDEPRWLNRDRFVLSAGHGSMFLYTWLHLSGYDLPLEEVKNFRQLHSKTPGHPEFRETPASNAPPVRSARASAMPSAWPSPARWPRRASTPPSIRSSTTT
jgi:hypothetical protein